MKYQEIRIEACHAESCLVLSRYYKRQDIQHPLRPLKYLATTQAIFFNNQFNTVQGKFSHIQLRML